MSSPRKRLSTFVSTGRDRFSDKLSRRGLEGHSRHRALLIGINYKNKQDDNYRTLRACTNDAKRIKDLLIGMGWTEHEITMMSDDLPSTSLLYPTKKKMKKQMKKFGQKARKGDNLFLYYAGHSGQVQATSDSDESDHCDEHLVSSDLKIILDNDVKIMLVDRLPAGCRLTAIFDACHSGTIMDLKDKHEPTSRSHTLDSRLANNSGANGPVRTAINRIPRRMASLPISAFAPIRTVAVNTSKYAVGKSKQILGIRRASNPQDREQEQNDTPAIPVQDINIQVQLSPIAEDGQQSYPWSPPQESNSRDHPVPSSAAKKDNMKHPRSLYKRRPREQTPTSPKSDGPVVICLSASWDSQQAYERKTGAIMTEHLLDLLGNNKKATVGEVSEALELRMFKADLRRLFQPKRQKEKSRIKHQTQQSAHAPVLDERPLSDEEARLQFIAQWQRPTITFQNSNADEIAHLPLFVERG